MDDLGVHFAQDDLEEKGDLVVEHALVEDRDFEVEHVQVGDRVGAVVANLNNFKIMRK